MGNQELLDGVKKASSMGPWMHGLLERLFPLCRSLTGPGNRETLSILSDYMELSVTEVPSGTDVFGWTVPDEWSPISAEITGPNGEVYANFADHNLHLVSSSQPIDMEIDLDELKEHIYSLPNNPDLIPYVTSYYAPRWGFCMRDKDKQNMQPGLYRARIDTKIKPGGLVYGEAVLEGETDKEILLSTYICHPSMAADNLAGVVLSAAIYKLLSRLKKRHYTYRFLFVPETIGAMCWLKNNETSKAVKNMHAGLVLSCVGINDQLIYEKSRQGNTELDRIAELVIGKTDIIEDFRPQQGSDERQFCSPGFNLPVGALMRMLPGWEFYHTSGDTPEQLTPEILASSLQATWKLLVGHEANEKRYVRTDLRGEPMLSKHGLYSTINIADKNEEKMRARKEHVSLMYLLNYADGEHDLVEIAKKCDADLLELGALAERLVDVGLLQ